MPEDTEEAKPNDLTGNWRKGTLIARGGQTAVYEAFRGESRGAAAIKILKGTNAKRAARFKQELEAHVRLSNRKAPNIIPLLDFSWTTSPDGRGSGFIVMPKAHSSLQDAFELFIGRVELALEVFTGIVRGVAEAHKEGIVHRDVKPANILFLDASYREPLIADFGICLLKSDDNDKRITEVGETVGARFYMAPEQELGGVVDVKPSADVYALAKVLCFMLTGRTLPRELIDRAFTDAEIAADPRLAIIRKEILSKTVVAEPIARIADAGQLLHALGQIELTKKITIPVVAVASAPDKAEKAPVEITPEPRPIPELVAIEYKRICSALTDGKWRSVALEFDGLKDNFDAVWSEIHSRTKEAPKESPEAGRQLILVQPKATAAALAIAKCDAVELIPSYKAFLEFIARSSGRLTGYENVVGIPHLQGGFLYMLCAVAAHVTSSWKTLSTLLNLKFESNETSGRPRFVYGIANPQFFHSNTFDRNAGEVHDFYRKTFDDIGFATLLKLRDQESLNWYLQTQLLMCLKAAQLNEPEERVRLWADFGRFREHRVAALPDRIKHDDHYATGVCKGFEETPETFLKNLNPRLAYIRRTFWSTGRYMWESIDSWEPES